MAELTAALIKKGAEAELYRGTWLGYDAVFKRRVRKEYRNPDLDLFIRGSRTSLESKLLAEARRNGVPTPVVFFIDLQSFEIIMSYVPGSPIKNVIPCRSPAALYRNRRDGRQDAQGGACPRRPHNFQHHSRREKGFLH
jgi:Kae1-associated kinase Bud32